MFEDFVRLVVKLDPYSPSLTLHPGDERAKRWVDANIGVLSAIVGPASFAKGQPATASVARTCAENVRAELLRRFPGMSIRVRVVKIVRREIDVKEEGFTVKGHVEVLEDLA